MAKLNYTARRISGVKAGQALKKDLSKRVPRDTDATNAKDVKEFKVRDQVIEIDISGRQLTHDGFKEFIAELNFALELKTLEYPQGVYKLQELHLQGNLLTIDSLVMLATVIELSSKDLRELDISNNNINILTDKDNRKWQYFLESFSQCCVLKKVDFSNNLLGARGIEILARVFIRSELDFIEADADANANADTDTDTTATSFDPLSLVVSDEHSSLDTIGAPVWSGPAAAVSHSAAHGTIHGIKSAQKKAASQGTQASKIPTNAKLRHFACTRGLRSIPYLLIQNVAMSNGGVIHLAEMVKLHRTPDHLLPFVPSGKPPSLPDPENALRGIYWLPNDELSPLSGKVMHLTDQMQQYTSESDTVEELTEDLFDMELDDDSYERRRGRQKLNLELSRVLKLHRIDVLGSEGFMKSELWHSALRMLTVARAILLDDKNKPPPVEEELQAAKKSRSGTGLSEEVGVKPTSARPPHPHPSSVLDTREDTSTPPGVLITSFLFDRRSATFDTMFPAIRRPPQNPVLQARPPPVAAAMSAYGTPVASASASTSRPQTSASQQSSSSSSSSKGKDKMPSSHEAQAHASHNRSKGTADSSATQDKHRFGLPLDVWRVIISDAIGVNGILHPDQQMKILSYAASWSALAGDISINGALEHQQVWKILDSIDCFTYKPLS